MHGIDRGNLVISTAWEPSFKQVIEMRCMTRRFIVLNNPFSQRRQAVPVRAWGGRYYKRVDWPWHAHHSAWGITLRIRHWEAVSLNALTGRGMPIYSKGVCSVFSRTVLQTWVPRFSQPVFHIAS